MQSYRPAEGGINKRNISFVGLILRDGVIDLNFCGPSGDQLGRDIGVDLLNVLGVVIGIIDSEKISPRVGVAPFKAVADESAAIHIEIGIVFERQLLDRGEVETYQQIGERFVRVRAF